MPVLGALARITDLLRKVSNLEPQVLTQSQYTYKTMRKPDEGKVPVSEIDASSTTKRKSKKKNANKQKKFDAAKLVLEFLTI
eukprot:scaffold22461_cov93-Cylindrotheca_fusiformis.AAC.1